MGKIVAIGGGETGKDGRPIETIAIDREILRLAGKDRPKLLFLPTASNDSEEYVELIRTYFGAALGCEAEALYLVAKAPPAAEIEAKILSADIIYVGGGQTGFMLETWRQFGVDRLLRQAHERGVVLSGLSAGSICWFRSGVSIKTLGLGLIDAVHCPHYDVRAEKHRESKEKLPEFMREQKGIAIGIDDRCALEVIDGRYQIIASHEEANAYRVFWKGGVYREERIAKDGQWRDLNTLLNISAGIETQ
jgi:dipeptidase E